MARVNAFSANFKPIVIELFSVILVVENHFWAHLISEPKDRSHGPMNHFLVHLRSSSEFKGGSWWIIIVAVTNGITYDTLLSLASHFVALLISQYKHSYCKMINKLGNKLNVCMCHGWTWWLGQLLGSGKVEGSKFKTLGWPP